MGQASKVHEAEVNFKNWRFGYKLNSKPSKTVFIFTILSGIKNFPIFMSLKLA
jgi:hypothetical protein